MQRLRETFRKRQSTLDTASESSKETTDSLEKALHSEPSSPRWSPTGPLSPGHRGVPLEQFKQQLSIPLPSVVDTKQTRSASFDEIRCREQVQTQDSIAEEEGGSPLLEVPGATGSKNLRSKSFDSATGGTNQSEPGQLARTRMVRGSPSSFLEIPKWKMFVRRSSAGTPGGSGVCPSELTALREQCVHCTLMDEWTRRHLSSLHSLKGSVESEVSLDIPEVNEESEWPTSVSGSRSTSASGDSIEDDDELRSSMSPIPLVTLSLAPDAGYDGEEDLGFGITVISLEVPVLPKSGRSASVDSSYLQVPKRTDIGCCELPPGKAMRSRSVDIALPVGPDGPYIAVPTDKPLPETTQ
ncbi:hypothetical protein HDE_03149 [Halotydeus destructor]|nr:hypothetical protein HDE_03149 [Halotydeus destructor]